MSRNNRPVPQWVLDDQERQERLAWKPTPSTFEAFKVRDLVLARHNLRVLGEDAHPDNTLHSLTTYGRAKATS